MTSILPKISFLASLAIQTTLAIVVVALCHQHRGFIKSRDDKEISLPVGSTGSFPMDALPEDLNTSAGKLNLANAVVALLSSMCLTLMILFANGQWKRVSKLRH